MTADSLLAIAETKCALAMDTLRAGRRDEVADAITSIRETIASARREIVDFTELERAVHLEAVYAQTKGRFAREMFRKGEHRQEWLAWMRAQFVG